MRNEMGTAAPPPAPSPDRTGVKKMLVLFAVLAILGVATLAFSVVLGLILLAFAEVFFAVAYRRFSRVSRRPKPSS
jgi:hypothetical protein